jgi:adenosylcobinamide-GDP ribazoletransferase
MAEAAARVAPARRTPFAELRAAVGFLTRIPVGTSAAAPESTGAAAFPLVGALIGAAAGVPVVLLGPAHPVIAAIVAIASIAVVDGGLHLDGLADTVDALAAPAGAAERARTDPRVGSAGTAAIVLVLALEVAALSEIAGRGAEAALVALVLAGSLSRVVAPILAVVAGLRMAPAAGLGRWFAERVGPVGAVLAVALAAAPVIAATSIPSGAPLAAGSVVGAAVAFLIVLGVVRARHQLDGDGYGFAIEATFALALAGCAVAG